MTTLNMSFVEVNSSVGLSHDNIKSHVLGIMNDLNECRLKCQYFKCDYEIILTIKVGDKPELKGVTTVGITHEELESILESFLKEMIEKGVNSYISTVTPIDILIPLGKMHQLPVETKKAGYVYQSVNETPHKAIMALIEMMFKDFEVMEGKKPTGIEFSMIYLITDSKCKESVNFISLTMSNTTIKMNNKVKFIKYFSTMETTATVFLSSKLVPDLMDLGSYIVTMKFVFD